MSPPGGDDLGVLESEALAAADRRADPMWSGGIRYFFVTAIESAVDVAQHICAAQGWGPPATNGAAMDVLGAKGVLTADLADLSDLRNFGGSVVTWLGEQHP